MHNKGLMSYSVEIMIDNLVLHVSNHAILEMVDFMTRLIMNDADWSLH